MICTFVFNFNPNFYYKTCVYPVVYLLIINVLNDSYIFVYIHKLIRNHTTNPNYLCIYCYYLKKKMWIACFQL